MQYTLTTLAGLAASVSATAIPEVKRSGGISITPHDSYSSSIGVLGCKIDTNRVAYWPTFPSCNNMCVKVSANGRSVNLLKIDQSGGAYDISYDAWNYLSTGLSAVDNPTTGGGVSATYEDVDMSECADLLKTEDQKLAFTAANSMGFVAGCLAEPSSWMAQNYALYNLANCACTLGEDEVCSLDLSVSNQPSCPHQLGIQTPNTNSNDTVENIVYGSGALWKAIQ